MNLSKLGKKLRREATANPKKAVFLGLAALVALYFWTPLIWGWIGKNDKSAAAMVAGPDAPAATAAAAPTEPSATKDKESVRPTWQQIVPWMHNDSRTMTALSLANTRDPFEPPIVEVAATEVAELSKPKPSVITPTSAGLVLTSTIVGPQRRIAQINGKTYVVGQTIEGAKEKEAVGASFTLKEIHPRRAVLEADDQQFELLIPEPGKSGKIELLETVGSR